MRGNISGDDELRRRPAPLGKAESISSDLSSIVAASRHKSKSKSSLSSSTRGSSVRTMQVRDLESDLGPVRLEDVLEFSSAVYYVDEASHISVDVVRLGTALGTASVEYATTDGSARAGIKYEAAAGCLEFQPGERCKSIHINILSDDAFDNTLEFSVLLDNPRGAVLGNYLHTCEVMILDDDSFPTNKYKTLLNAGLASEIPSWPLIFEYMYMHMQERGMRRAFIITLLCDQISNLKYIWAILLTNYTIDEVLKPPEGEKKPEHVHTIMYVITALGFVPHILLWLLERFKAYQRINGRGIDKLQQNLLRKFLNYDENARSKVSASDLQMAITRDVPELVEESFSSIFGILRNLGLLAIFVSVQVRKIGTSMGFTAGLFVGFPVITTLFLSCREKGTTRRRDHVFKCQTVLVSFIQQTTDCYRLINDYMQRPLMVDLFAEKVSTSNKASLQAKVWSITNEAFTPMLTFLMVGCFVLYSYNSVLDGGLLGEFLTGCAIWKGIGDCYQTIFSDVRQLQQVIAPLQNIVFYMNLEVDMTQKKTSVVKMLEEARQAMKVAEDQIARKAATHSPYVIRGTNITTGCFTDEVVFAADLLQICARGVSFAYPQHAGCAGAGRVIDQVSFEIPQGRMVAITGPRGSGKATLLNLIGDVLRLDQSSGGSLFVPPHLRVLNVSSDPQSISDLDLFANLCFGQPRADHHPKRVLAICRRLGMSHQILHLVEQHAHLFSSEAGHSKNLKRSGSAIEQFGLASHWNAGNVTQGTAYSVTKRHGAEMMANDGSMLSQTDRCLIHLARAFVENPDVLILHKPLAQLDEHRARLLFNLLKEFVDLRGVETSPEGRLLRRPRTCIFSVSDSRYADCADKVFHVAHGNVAPVDIDELDMLRHCARKLFDTMDANCDNLVNQEEFVTALQQAPWAAEWLGVTRDGNTSEDLGEIFCMLDRRCTGQVDFDDLVQHLRTRFEGALPQVLAALHAPESSPTNASNGLLNRAQSWHGTPQSQVRNWWSPQSGSDAWKLPEIAIEIPMFSTGSKLHDLHANGKAKLGES